MNVALEGGGAPRVPIALSWQLVFIELAGLGPSAGRDQLSAAGSITLAGTLDVMARPTFSSMKRTATSA